MLDHLEVRRDQIHSRLQTLIINELSQTRMSSDCAECGWGAHHTLSHVSLLLSSGLLGDLGDNSSLLEKVERFRVLKNPAPLPPWKSCGSRWHRIADYQESRSVSVEVIRKSTGICLDCFRKSTNVGKYHEPCRIKHE